MESSKKKDWNLTSEAFEALLAVFDASNRENAVREYENQRTRLIRFFEWRNAPSPDEKADETFNRIARKIAEGEEIRAISSFVGGVARLVLLEGYDEAKRDEKFSKIRAILRL